MTDSVPSAHQASTLNIHASASRLAALVINSDSAEQSLLNQLLEGLGHDVSVAANGTQAQELVNRHVPFSIIFLADELPRYGQFRLSPGATPPHSVGSAPDAHHYRMLQHGLEAFAALPDKRHECGHALAHRVTHLESNFAALVRTDAVRPRVKRR